MTGDEEREFLERVLASRARSKSRPAAIRGRLAELYLSAPDHERRATQALQLLQDAFTVEPIGRELSPRERFGTSQWHIGRAYFVKRQFDEAAAKLLLAIQDHPRFPGPYRTLAACYAHMGRLDEARAIVARLRAITPQVMPTGVSYLGKPEDRELFLSGLRIAMGEN
jgi:Flp pilus assembly protein TadD